MVAWAMARSGDEVREARRIGVYFVADAQRSVVKIGTSEYVDRRIRDLARVNAGRIDLLAVIDGHLHVERFLHEKWSHLRLHGEWFRLDDDLSEFIAAVSGNPHAAAGLCPDRFAEDMRYIESQR
jgi:hypothetical protein